MAASARFLAPVSAPGQAPAPRRAQRGPCPASSRAGRRGHACCAPWTNCNGSARRHRRRRPGRARMRRTALGDAGLRVTLVERGKVPRRPRAQLDRRRERRHDRSRAAPGAQRVSQHARLPRAARQPRFDLLAAREADHVFIRSRSDGAQAPAAAAAVQPAAGPRRAARASRCAISGPTIAPPGARCGSTKPTCRRSTPSVPSTTSAAAGVSRADDRMVLGVRRAVDR